MIKDKYNIPVLERLSKELGLSIDELEKVHDSPFKFSRRTIKELNFREISLDEFKKSKKVFNIPGLCKLYPSEKMFNQLNFRNVSKNDL